MVRAAPSITAPRQSAWHGIVRNTGWLIAGKVISAVLSLAYLGMATRALGPTAFGQFVLILGTAQAIAALVSFETWQLVMRFGMDHVTAARPGALGRLIAFCMTLDVGGAILGAGIASVAVTQLAPLFGWSPKLEGQSLAFCFVLLASFRSAAIGVLRMHDRFGASAFAETMLPVFRMIGVLVVLSMGATVPRVLAAWAIAEFLTAVTHWVLAFRTLPPKRAWFRWTGMLSVPREHPGFWRFAGVTNAGSTMALFGKQFAILLVGAEVSPAAAGGYRIAHQLGQALANVSDMLSRATFSEIMRARSSEAVSDLRLLFRNASRIAMITAGIMIALLLLLGHIALGLLGGPHYASAFPLVLILGTAAAIDAGGVSFEPALLASGKAWISFRLRLLATVVLIVGLVVLLDKLGPIGAAVATLTASTLATLTLGLAARRAIYR
jgi:O-antigen/teichoic acid export membrane protein